MERHPQTHPLRPRHPLQGLSKDELIDEGQDVRLQLQDKMNRRRRPQRHKNDSCQLSTKQNREVARELRDLQATFHDATEAIKAERRFLSASQAELVQMKQALDTTTDELQSYKARQSKIEDELSAVKRRIEQQEHEAKHHLAEALRTVAEKQEAITKLEDRFRECRDLEKACMRCSSLVHIGNPHGQPQLHQRAIADLHDGVGEGLDRFWTGNACTDSSQQLDPMSPGFDSMELD